ncbi:hypothetical protein Hanom_Chr09g00785131 [Helianthus anomalus]
MIKFQNCGELCGKCALFKTCVFAFLNMDIRGCLVLRFQNRFCVFKTAFWKKHVGTCFSNTAFWRQIITFSSKHLSRLFMFYKRNNQIITLKRNPKHPLSCIQFVLQVLDQF